MSYELSHRIAPARPFDDLESAGPQFGDRVETAIPPTKQLSIIVPVFNEQDAIVPFLARAVPVLQTITGDWEILFVNDGSRDDTWDRIRDANRNDSRILGVDFSRNFGKEIALSAGLDHASGRCVVPIDVDLQDPPELIPTMVAKWREGFDVVVAKRIDRTSDSLFKRTSAKAFDGLIARMSRVEIPEDVGDFRLMDHTVVSALRTFTERERFMKGIFASVGFKTTTVTYTREKREVGSTKFSTLGLFNLALEGIVSFSTAPLKIWTYVGFGSAAFAVLYTLFIIARTLVFGINVPGYASIVSLLLLFNGLLLMGVGIQGEYIARIFAEVKARPLYFVRERIEHDQPMPLAPPKSRVFQPRVETIRAGASTVQQQVETVRTATYE